MSAIQTMSDSEMEIMKIIWESGGSILLANLLEIIEARNKKWKRSTVQTFLSRMVEKNRVTFKKTGRATEYLSLISEEEYLAEQTEAFVQKMYNGSSKSLVSALLKRDRLTTKDIEDIKTFWNEGEDIHE